MRVLYVSYDGMLEPLGQSQVLPYLRRLASLGYKFTLISFEKPDLVMKAGGAVAALKRELGERGINWRALPYHKRPTVLATLFDICQGIGVGLKLNRVHPFDIVHARSYVSALVCWALSWLTHAKFVFDMRGFWADERVEGGIWHRGLLYLTVKRLERLFIRRADAIVSLTTAAERKLREIYGGHAQKLHITVIPTCVDTERFMPRGPDLTLLEEIGFEGKLIFVYVGSVGTWYAMDEILDFFGVVITEIPTAALLLIVRGPVEPLQAAVEHRGLLARTEILTSVPNEDIPKWLSVAHVGVAFYEPCFSNIARFPTKIGEYLASGLPVIVSGEVGDCDRLIEGKRVGISLREFTLEEYRRTARALQELLRDHTLSARCRSVALEHLSVSEGVKQYASIYRKIIV